MAWEGFQVILPGLYSTQDLSSYQYHPVVLSGTNTIDHISTTTAGVDYPIGILQNAPSAAGQAAEVCIFGITKVIMGGTASYNDLLGNDTANGGHAVAVTANVTTNTNATWGRVIQGAVSSAYATAFVNFANLQVGTS